MKRPATATAAPSSRSSAVGKRLRSPTVRRVRRGKKAPQGTWVRPGSLKRLEDWLRQSGVTWSEEELTFASSKAHGIGVFAKKLLPKSRAVARIPVSICLGIETCSIAKKLKQLLRNGTLDEELALVLAVLSERRLGQRSKWDGYFRCCLRRDVPHTPQVWSRREQQMLHGTECDRCDEAKWHSHAQRQRQAENKALLSRMQPLMKSLFAKGEPVTWKEYKEVSYWCESRAFNLGEEAQGEVLCPLADLFNHRSAPRRSSAGSNNGFGGDIAVCSSGREDHVTIMTQNRVEGGEEVFNCYGAHGNAKLLADYGFCCYPNPHTRVILRPSSVIYVAARRYSIDESKLRESLREVVEGWGDEPEETAVRCEVRRKFRSGRPGNSEDSGSDDDDDEDEEGGLVEGFSLRRANRQGTTSSTSSKLSTTRGEVVIRTPKGLQKLASSIVGLCRQGNVSSAARRRAADPVQETSRLLEAVAKARQLELLAAASPATSSSPASTKRGKRKQQSGSRLPGASSPSHSSSSPSKSSWAAALKSRRSALAEALRKEELCILKAFLADLRRRRQSKSNTAK